MARYLLVEFDDDKQADALRAQIDAATRKGRKFRVVGLFARPGKKSCTCVRSMSDYKANQVVRGAKYGWWVCETCHRPRLGRQDLRNLLPMSDVIDPDIREGIDMLAVSPRVEVFQMQIGELTLWPNVRRDLQPSLGVEEAPEAGPYENGELRSIETSRRLDATYRKS